VVPVSKPVETAFGVETGEKGEGLGWSKALDVALPKKPLSQSSDYSIIPAGVRAFAPKKRMTRQTNVVVEYAATEMPQQQEAAVYMKRKI
jgi:hypothetical protein